MTNRDRIPDAFVFTDSNEDYLFLDEIFNICNRRRIHFKSINEMSKYFRITFNLKDTQHIHPVFKNNRVALRKIKPSQDNMDQMHKRHMKMLDVMKYIDMYLEPKTWTKLARLRDKIESNHKVILPTSQSILKWIRYNNVYDSSVELGIRK